MAAHSAIAEEGVKPETHVKDQASEATSKEAPDTMKLPGLTVRIKEKCVDVDAEVCLREGLLELVVTTNGGKTHESIFAVSAKPSHMHAALLLLGSKPGNPAMRKKVGDGRWLDLPPRGENIAVSVLIKGDGGKLKEYPIKDFLRKASDDFGSPDPIDQPEEEEVAFPTSSFLFAGSQLYRPEDGAPVYLADMEGNVISLSTFGDELLCLPGVHAHANGALAWEVNSEHLPKLGSKVTLRLRPEAKTVAPVPEQPTDEK